ncbi:paired amphipathic helix protein Sin3-like 5 isoform X1 [Zingiber officinale]|uniref:paired amphipathic helix protein Sin3-like 5 isoform X1 n=1 Tax=Zingiber officinale TaxID=94328 RepID=UPI001C4B4B41|nr:paired amphipathic helix protein Sin3-like 5 isoform X1 [Zingiber officinale]XP_042379583.1 paired amphipathic helix protein Sin3-like 5 isoform X1 [Zingiber officinale]
MDGSKAVRDEALMSSQLRRTNSPREDRSGQNQMAPAPAAFGTTSKLTTNDALTYLKAVKVVFHDETETYDEFLKVMKDFKSLRICTNEVIIRVKQLFKGHWDLIMGFNTFLPKGYEIKLPEEKKPKYDEAVDLVHKIKDRFENDEYVYKSFIDILNMYRRGNKQIHEVYEEVTTLFKNHQDLLKEFTHFLPVAPAISPSHHGYANREFACQDEMKPAARHFHEKKLERAYRPHTECNSSIDCPDIEHDRKRRRSETERITSVVTDKKDHERDKDLEHGDLDKAHHTYKSSSQKPDYPIPGKMQRGADGTENIGICVYTREFNFCEKVKDKVHPDTYQEFLKCLDMYSKEIIMRTELKNVVNDILGKYPEIMEGFNEFLLNCEDIDGFLEGFFNKRYLVKHGKIEDRERDREVVKWHKDHEWERNTAKERVEKGTLKATFFSNKEKYDMWKPISELDLSNCQSCTPSYRLLPKNYPIPSSHRTRLGKSVLNDDWVLVTSGSEDRSFKHMLKNQHEETLFVCEDDRFEMDLLLGLVNATTKRVEKLVEMMQDPMTSKSPIHIEDHLTSSHLRCVERLYGDHGLDVMDVLQKNANLALPVILTRLKQKQEEWSRCHSDFNRAWAEIYAKNFHKSLDHRSFYFKRQDSKNLRTKSLLSEIKEINNKLKENDVLLAVAAHNRHPIIPNMEFEYGDVGIHEDLYQMIKYSSREVCTSSDQFDKVMKLWNNFLEPLLGVPNRSVVDDYQHVRCESHAVYGTPCQTKLSHGAESILHDQAGSCRTGFTNGNATAKNCFHHAEQVTHCVKNYFDSPLQGRVRGSYHMFDEVARAAVQNVPTEHVPNGNNDASRAEEAHAKTSPENTSGTNGVSIRTVHFVKETIVEPQASSETLPCTKVGHSGRLIASDNDGISEYIRPSEGPASINNSKIEREEGELSPSRDFEEDNAYNAKANDEDVGSAPRSNEISENASESGEDVSISESGNVMECSHEDHEEEDDAEHDNQDVKDESEGEAEGVTKAHDAGGEITAILDSEKFLNTAKPLARHVPATLHDKHDKSSQIFYGNDSFYVLLRLHQILYERMLSAKINSSAAQNKWSSKDTKSPDLYAKFLSILYDLLDGSADNTKFEDDCRAIIGTQSYVLFTLDKLIYKVVKQLQAVASDEMSNKLLHLYLYENSRQTGRSFDIVYHENARALLHDENLYRFECFSQPLDVTRLSIQLMDYTHENPGVAAVSTDFSFSSSLYSDFLSSASIRKGSLKGVFLKRNKRKYNSTDENSTTCKAMKGIQMFNGLECQISCSSSKTRYVVDTEDSLFQMTKKRRHPSGDTLVNNQAHSGQVHNAKIQRFHSFISGFLSRS